MIHYINQNIRNTSPIKFSKIGERGKWVTKRIQKSHIRRRQSTVSAIENYPSFSDVIAERLKRGSLTVSQKRVSKTKELCFSNGIMMNMSNEETQWVQYVVRYIHSSALFIHRDNWDFEAEKTRERMFKMSWTDWLFILPIWQKGLLVRKTHRKKENLISVKIGFCSILIGFRSPLNNSQFEFFQLFVEGFR